MSWSLVLEHLYIVLFAIVMSIGVGLPLGVVAYISPKLRKPILWVSDLFQTVPSLALLGIIMVFLGAGKLTVIFGITLYSLLPIVRNTCLGLQEVDASLKEAAKGCGMNRFEQLFQVELPQAFPTIFTGVRIAVVNAIGTAVFAAFVGGGGLGAAIYQGIRTSNMKLILVPTFSLMAIAFIFDTLMGRVEHSFSAGKKQGGLGAKILLTAIAAVSLIVLVWGTAAYGGGTSGTIKMYDGDYSETQILTKIVKLLVEDRTGLEVTVMDQMSQVNNFNELVGNGASCDLMISYDGTLLTTFLHQDTTDIPEGMTLYDYVNEQAMEKYNIRLLSKLGLNNTYAIAVTEQTAEKYGLECVSDLIPVAGELTFGAEHGFFTQEGSMKYNPFTEFYGLKFKAATPVDIGLKYSAIANGSFEVTEVYATDGLNRKANLKVLDDDKSFFPEYNGAVLVRSEIFEKFASAAPNLEEVLNELGGIFTNEIMTELTYQVDVEGKSVDEVAAQFMRDQGLVG